MSERPLPRRIYLDTSVVAGAIVEGIEHSAASSAFCQQLIEADSQVFFSEILLLELSETIRKLATIPGQLPSELRGSFQLEQWERSHFVRQRWMAHGIQQFDALVGRFVEVFVLPFRRTTWLASVRVMADERLRSHDAVHLATAREHRIPSLATVDAHFAKAHDIDIWLIRDSGQ